MSALFRSLRLRSLEIPNRCWVSPMCQYSAEDGVVGAWHRMHLGVFATGGAGLIMAEATGVVPEGSLDPQAATPDSASAAAKANQAEGRTVISWSPWE